MAQTPSFRHQNDPPQDAFLKSYIFPQRRDRNMPPRGWVVHLVVVTGYEVRDISCSLRDWAVGVWDAKKNSS